jgi:hypothetical protein
MFLRPQKTKLTRPLRVTSALLAVWILVLSLAGVSPALHGWLHADSGCAHECGGSHDEEPANADGHYCGVVALQGALATVVPAALPELSNFERLEYELRCERFAAEPIDRHLQARAPPFEILV